MALNLQKRTPGLGFTNIREADTAEAAADIYGRTKEQFDRGALGRALDRPLRPGEPGPRDPWQPASGGIISRDAAPVRTLPTGAGVQQTKDKPGTTPTAARKTDSDPFGTLVDILTSVVSFGVPVRKLIAGGMERRQREQDIQAYDMIISGTKNLIATIGNTPAGPERDQAVDVQIAALNLIQPGVGDSVRETWEAHTSGSLNLDVLEKPWIKAAAAGNCGTGPGAQDCVNKFTADEGWVQRQDDMHYAAMLPDIDDWMRKIISQAVGDGDNPEVTEVLAQLGEDGWTASDLLRLPEEFQFLPEQMDAIINSTIIQDHLADSFGFRPSGLGRKALEAEITGAGLTPLARLQKERDAAEAARDQRRIDEVNKKIEREITIVGRTPEDLRTGLTGTTPKDLDELRSGIRDLQGNLNNLEKTRKAFEANPEAGGILGAAIENIGGLLGQIPFIGGNLEDMLPGDAEEVRKARTRARFVVSSMLSTITAEDSGRFTDTERRIAGEALGALDITASPRQIQTALETAFEIVTDSQNRKVDELFSASGLDLAKIEGVDAFNGILLNNGFTSKQAEDAIFTLLERRGIRVE